MPGINEVRLEALTEITNEGKERGPFKRALSTEISGQDRDFICSFIKLGYRDRPATAKLLEHKWFADLER